MTDTLIKSIRYTSGSSSQSVKVVARADSYVKKITVGTPITAVTGTYSIRLNDVVDVKLSEAQQDDTLVYDSGLEAWVNRPIVLDARSQFSVTSSGDGSLTYNDSTGEFAYVGPSAAEVRSHFSAGGDLSYDSASGQFSFSAQDVYTPSDFDSDFALRSTTDLSEGSNLYYTDVRVDTRVGQLAIDAATFNGDSASYYLDYANFTGTPPSTYTTTEFNADFATKTTSDLTEGSNLYYTDGRVDTRIGQLSIDADTLDTQDGSYYLDYANFTGTPPSTYTNVEFDSDLALKTTDDVAEGSNLYHTTARVRQSLGASNLGGMGTLSYNDATGVVAYQGPDSDLIRTAIATSGTGTSFNQSTGQIDIGQDVATTSNVTFNDLVVDGDLTVNGNTTIINTQELQVEDNIITLNYGYTGAPTLDAGIEIERGDAANISILWDESELRWDFVGQTVYSTGGFVGNVTGQVSDVSNHSTDDISEGSTNLYYTTGRVDGRVNLIVDKTFVDALNVDADTLDNQDGSYYLDYNNFVNTPTIESSGETYTGFDSDFGTKTTDDLAQGLTNLYYDKTLVDSDFEQSFATKTTTDLPEGSNLYYTEARVVANTTVASNTAARHTHSNKSVLDNTTASFTVAEESKLAGIADNANNYTHPVNHPWSILTGTPTTIAGYGITDAYTSTDFDADFSGKSTTNLSEGTNLYWTQDRFNTALGNKTTDDLTEGSNLYFTDARVNTNSNVSSNTAARHVHANKALLDTVTAAYTTADSDKLAGIEASANNYTHPANHDWSIINNTPTTLAGYGITDGYDSADFELHFGTKSTTDVVEGSNLYYTEGRVSANTDVASNTAARHTHANKAILDATTASFTTADETKLDGIDDNANAYVHPANHDWSIIQGTPTSLAGYGINDDLFDSADFTSELALRSTDNLTEGSNLYYTVARANSAIDTRVDKSFVDALGINAAQIDGYEGAALADKYTQAQVDTLLEGKQDVENGFEDRSDSTISFVNGTRTFTVAPTATNFVVYSNGVKYTKTASNVVIPDTEGLHYIYFNAAGTLTSTMSFTDQLITDWAFVATVYWNATDNVAVSIGDERHGKEMDSQTHLYLHNTAGTIYGSGLNVLDVNADSDGSTNDQAQIGLSSGVIWDEDIKINISVDAAPANAPIVYRSGSNGDWKKIAATDYIVTTTGSGRAAYNENTGSTWQLTEVADSDYTIMHLMATNDITDDWILVVGQDEYADLSTARANAQVALLALDLENFPWPEYKSVASFIIHTANGYTNAVKSIVQTTEEGADFVDWRNVAVSVANSVSGGTITAWGDITGTLSSQTDLQSALDGKLSTTGKAADTTLFDGDSAGYYLDHNNHTNKPDYFDSADFDIAFTAKSTTDLSEGSNLYYTEGRVSANTDVAANTAVRHDHSNKAILDATTASFLVADETKLDGIENNANNYTHPATHDWSIIDGTPTTLAGYGITDGYDSADWEEHFGTKSTTNVPEGSNLYYTEGRVSANTDVAANTTARHTHANKATLDNIEEAYSTVEKNKLAGVDSDANNYVHPANHDWSIINGTPTTLAGYGITDGYDSADFELHFGTKSTTNVPEGSNLYYTASRVNSAIDGRVDKAFVDALNIDADTLDNQNGTYYLDYNNFTNKPTLYTTTTFNADFSGKTTSDLSEGANLYYTEGRVSSNTDVASNTAARHTHSNQSVLDATTAAYNSEDSDKLATVEEFANNYSHPVNHPWSILTGTPTTIAGYGITDAYDTSDFTTDFTAKSTTDLSEGTNLYYTTGRATANFNNNLALASTTDLDEGTNLYYTTSRANSAIDARVTKAYVDGLSINANSLDGEDGTYYLDYANFTGTPPSTYGTAEFDSDFGDNTTTDLTEGTNLYYTVARANSAIDTRVNKAFVDALNVDADTLDNQDGAYYLDFNNFTNVPASTAYDSDDFLVNFGNQTTDGLTEGTSNLYYIKGRVDSDIDGRITQAFVNNLDVNADTLDNQHGTYYLDYANFTGTPPSTYDSSDFAVNFANQTTSGLTEGSNLYYTEVRVSANTDVAANTAARHSHANKATLDSIEEAYSTVEKNKLASIDSDANNYTHPANHDWSIINGTPTTLAGYGITDGYDSADWEEHFGTKSTTDVSEGTNLYYTTARVNSAFDTRLGTKSTTDLSEGSNLYYTEGRVSANTDVAANTAARHSHSNKAILDATTASFTTADETKLDGIADNANNYTHPANHPWSILTGTPTTLAGYGITDDLFDSADFDTEFASKSTTDLSEGSNLYHTTARARSSISVTDTGGDGSLSYSSGTGVLTYTGPSASDTRAHFSGGTGVDITNGVVSIGQPVGPADSCTFGGLTVAGDLYVSGTTTTINTQELKVSDNIITLNNDVTGTPTEDGGVEIERGTSDNKSILWLEATDEWSFGSENVVAGSFTGDVTGTVSDISNHSTTDLSEGTNLYYTEARVNANTNVAANTSARHTHSNKAILDATTASFTTADETKLDGIDDNANNYTHPANHPWSILTGTPTTLAGYGITDDLVDSGDVSAIITADVDKAFVDALNVDADTLDNQNGTYYLDAGNLTGNIAPARLPNIAGDGLTWDGTVLNVDSSNVWRPIDDTPTDGATTTSISSNWAFDNVKTAVPSGAVFTDTLYTSFNTDFDTRLGTKSTTDLSEGSNLYYTEGRVSANTDVAANTAARHSHSNKAILDATTASFLVADETKLDGIEDNANNYTSFNSDFDTRLGTKSTTDLSEGNNKYFTDWRARGSISVSGDLTYDSDTGIIGYSPVGGGTTVTVGPTPPGSPDANSLWWDNEDGELRIYYEDSDGSQWVDASSKTGPRGEPGPFGPKTVTVGFPTASEDITLFYTNTEVTVQDIRSVIRQSGGSSVSWTLRYGSDRTSTGTEVVTGGMTANSDTTGVNTTSFNNPVIAAGNFVWIETSSISGSVQEFNVTIDFI